MRLNLEADGRGHIDLVGEVADESGSGNRLAFGFELDQTHLVP